MQDPVFWALFSCLLWIAGLGLVIYATWFSFWTVLAMVWQGFATWAACDAVQYLNRQGRES